MIVIHKMESWKDQKTNAVNIWNDGKEKYESYEVHLDLDNINISCYGRDFNEAMDNLKQECEKNIELLKEVLDLELP